MSDQIYYRFGLVGWPLKHSLSPRIHEAALHALGLDGQYRLFSVASGQQTPAELLSLIERVRRRELHGLNVTIPHKLEILKHAEALAPAATAIGAANTLYHHRGRVWADNTDASGFMAALQAEFPGLGSSGAGQTALILGAGGGARAAAFALLQAGWRVVVAARSPASGLALAAQLHPAAANRLTAIQLESASLLACLQSSLLAPLTLVINATPAGMFPHVEHSPWPPNVPLPIGAAVFDMIYHPSETTFTAAARSAGMPACTGLRMLVEQAARAFELWTGLPFPRPVVWQDLRKELPIT